MTKRSLPTPARLEHGDPVDELARRRALAQARQLAQLVEGHRRPDRRARRSMSGWCTRTMRFISSGSGKSMKWNTQRRRNASGSSFSLFDVMMTTGRSLATISSPVSMIDEAHAIELVEQVVRELEVGLVDLVDEEHDALRRRERAAERAELDVVADVLHVAVAEARSRRGAAPCRRRRGRPARASSTSPASG